MPSKDIVPTSAKSDLDHPNSFIRCGVKMLLM